MILYGGPKRASVRAERVSASAGAVAGARRPRQPAALQVLFQRTEVLRVVAGAGDDPPVLLRGEILWRNPGHLAPSDQTGQQSRKPAFSRRADREFDGARQDYRARPARRAKSSTTRQRSRCPAVQHVPLARGTDRRSRDRARRSHQPLRRRMPILLRRTEIVPGDELRRMDRHIRSVGRSVDSHCRHGGRLSVRAAGFVRPSARDGRQGLHVLAFHQEPHLADEGDGWRSWGLAATSRA